MLSFFRKDIFGNSHFVKKWVIRIIGIVSYRRFRGINNLIISGTENIKSLPDKNVLFISNHQTYFADASAIIHVINATLSGRSDSIKNVSYIWKPKLNLYYIAAKETMADGWLPKILSYAGSIPIERTWREGGKDVKRDVNKVNIKAINSALNDGWVITFPQGTTKPWMPVRKGTAHIIKSNKPILNIYQFNWLKFDMINMVSKIQTRLGFSCYGYYLKAQKYISVSNRTQLS